MTVRYFAFHDAQYNQDFAVWAYDEMGAWRCLYNDDPVWAENCVTFLREISFEEQEKMKQFY